MSLSDVVNEARYENAPISTDLPRIADNVWPDMWLGDEAPKYRQIVLRQFLRRDGTPLREAKGYSFTKDETRLLRAWGDVAQVSDVCENTIRKCVLRMYDKRMIPADREEEVPTLPDQFLHDLKDIEEKWRQKWR